MINADGDIDIDITDFNILATNFNPTGYDTTSTIPEPSTLVLFTLGILGTTGTVFYRRRQ